jgi:cytochrome oxidase assembly protein ShyY1
MVAVDIAIGALLLLFVLAWWDVIRLQRQSRNTYEEERQRQNDAIRLARSFDQPAAKGLERRRQLENATKLGDRR